MSIVVEFLDLAKWLALATLLTAILTVVAFRRDWGIRFRLVGVTSFLVVLVVGSFALSLGLYQYTEVEGAAPYTVTYDTGGTQAVIRVDNSIDPETLEATLKQAAFGLYSSGRYAKPGESQLTIRARTVIHPSAGLSQPLFLGQIRRSLFQRSDENMEVSLNLKQFEILQDYLETSNPNLKS
ncbi:MAG: Ycf51 family protein [Prochlorothrix sp.]|nr:Ycf51 family protein [Prochlorothrix sp.]